MTMMTKGTSHTWSHAEVSLLKACTRFFFFFFFLLLPDDEWELPAYTHVRCLVGAGEAIFSEEDVQAYPFSEPGTMPSCVCVCVCV